jgi:hypothetical protein
VHQAVSRSIIGLVCSLGRGVCEATAKTQYLIIYMWLFI